MITDKPGTTSFVTSQSVYLWKLELRCQANPRLLRLGYRGHHVCDELADRADELLRMRIDVESQFTRPSMG